MIQSGGKWTLIFVRVLRKKHDLAAGFAWSTTNSFGRRLAANVSRIVPVALAE